MNFPFVGTARLDFTIHLAGLGSALPQDFDDNAHQVAILEDDGARQVQSRGLAFVPRATAAVTLEEGSRPVVTTMLCSTFAALSQ